MTKAHHGWWTMDDIVPEIAHHLCVFATYLEPQIPLVYAIAEGVVLANAAGYWVAKTEKCASVL